MTARSHLFRIAARRYGPFEKALRAQWAAFEAEHATGLTLDLVLLELPELEDALFPSGGMKDGAWDVAFVATDWIASMQTQSCALDLGPLLLSEAPAEYPDGWTDSLLRLQRIHNSVLGVPYHDGPECLIYRKDLFADEALNAEYAARFGRKLAPPSTWEEFHQVARFLHRPQSGVYGAVFAALPDGHNSVYDFLLQLWSRGGELIGSDGSVCFDTREAADALLFHRTLLSDTEAVHPRCGSLDSVAAGAAFASGEAAMTINWLGFATAAHDGEHSAVRGRVDIAPVPCGAGGRSVSLNVYWILSIARGSPHPQVAWSFLRHLLSPAMDKLTTTSGAIGCRRSTWADPDVNAAIPFYHRIEELHACAREIPQRADWPSIAAAIDALLSANLKGDRSVPELLREAEARLELPG